MSEARRLFVRGIIYFARLRITLARSASEERSVFPRLRFGLVSKRIISKRVKYGDSLFRWPAEVNTIEAFIEI